MLNRMIPFLGGRQGEQKLVTSKDVHSVVRELIDDSKSEENVDLRESKQTAYLHPELFVEEVRTCVRRDEVQRLDQESRNRSAPTVVDGKILLMHAALVACAAVFFTSGILVGIAQERASLQAILERAEREREKDDEWYDKSAPYSPLMEFYDRTYVNEESNF